MADRNAGVGGYEPENGPYKIIYWYCPICDNFLEKELGDGYSEEMREAAGFEPTKSSTPKNRMANAYRPCGGCETAVDLLTAAPTLVEYVKSQYDVDVSSDQALHALAASRTQRPPGV